MSSTMEVWNNTPNSTLIFDFLPVDLRQWHHTNERFICVLSIFTNTILIILLLTERNQTLKAYARVLFQNSVIDICYTIAVIVTEVQMEFIDGRMILVVNGGFYYLPMAFHYVMAVFWTTMCASSILVMPILFYFRYELVVRNHLMSKLKLAAIAAPLIGVGLVEGLFVLLSSSHNDAIRHELCPLLLSHPIWTLGETDLRKCIICNSDNIWTIMYLIVALVFDFLIYGTMMFTTMRVLAVMQENRTKMSERTMRMQRQMNMMLFVQMTLPIFSSIIPITLMIACPVFRITIPGMGILVTFAFSWVPLVSPITTILMVSNFRGRIIRFVKRLLAHLCTGQTDKVATTDTNVTDTNSDHVFSVTPI